MPMTTTAIIPPAMPPLAESERPLLAGLGVGLVFALVVELAELRNY